MELSVNANHQPTTSSKSALVVPQKPKKSSFGRQAQTHFGNIQRTTQGWKRRQFWALLGLRVGFVLLAPISVVGLALLFVVGTMVHGTYLATFTLCASQSRMILTSLTKAALAVVLASLCGILLPVFATFGLVISILQCGLELTEPILRIRYQRQLRKIEHLHKLLTGTSTIFC